MITPIFLILLGALEVALIALVVRSQVSLTRGFDLSVGAFPVVASAIYLVVTGVFNFGPLGALFISGSAILLLSIAWNFLLVGIITNRIGGDLLVLLVSLGVVVLVEGGIGIVRGPDREYASVGDLVFFSDNPPTYAAFALLLAVALGVLAWFRSSSSLALDLYGQNQIYAREVGIDARQLVLTLAIVNGVLLTAVGVANLLREGAAPGDGMELFLYGAAGALLLGSSSLRSAVIGGGIIGATTTGLQMFVSPVFIDMMAFAVIAVLLLFRGTARSLQGER